jgi:hypothetical protein
MNRFKNIIFSAVLSLGAFSAITYTACTKDECKDVVCQNGGTCVSGTCNCTTGYEGTNCETESRTKFIKSWSAADQIGSTNLVYTVAIAGGSAINGVLISNAFSDNFFSNPINATVEGNTITIPDQRPDGAASNFRVMGTGTYASGKITWNYTITRITPNEPKVHTGIWQ